MKKALAGMIIGAASVGFSATAMASPSLEKTTYTAAKDAADSQYKLARNQCNSITGNPKDVCIAEASAVRDRAKASAEGEFKNTIGARTEAQIKIAEADYEVAKARCGSQTGNPKDVCIKEAQAMKVAATSDAKAAKKTIVAHVDANDDKRAAEYKVAIEKCDALAGPAKDGCVSTAKADFGK